MVVMAEAETEAAVTVEEAREVVVMAAEVRESRMARTHGPRQCAAYEMARAAPASSSHRSASRPTHLCIGRQTDQTAASRAHPLAR